MEDLDVRDREGERRERRLGRPGVLPGPGGVADDLPVVEVDEQADVVPRGVSVNIIFTIFTNVFSPIAPTRMCRFRRLGALLLPVLTADGYVLQAV